MAKQIMVKLHGSETGVRVGVLPTTSAEALLRTLGMELGIAPQSISSLQDSEGCAVPVEYGSIEDKAGYCVRIVPGASASSADVLPSLPHATMVKSPRKERVEKEADMAETEYGSGEDKLEYCVRKSISVITIVPGASGSSADVLPSLPHATLVKSPKREKAEKSEAANECLTERFDPPPVKDPLSKAPSNISIEGASASSAAVLPSLPHATLERVENGTSVLKSPKREKAKLAEAGRG